MSAVFVHFSVLGRRDEFQVVNVVVERVVVLVVDQIAFWHRAVVVLPNRDVESGFADGSIPHPAPEIDSSTSLFGIGVSMKLPAVEDNRLRGRIARVHPAVNRFW